MGIECSDPRIRIEYEELSAHFRQSRDEYNARLIEFPGGGFRDTHRTVAWIAERAIDALSQGLPLAITRYGDGEGSLLFYREKRREFPVLSELLTDRIVRLMFGNAQLSEAALEELAGNVFSAMLSSDIVGLLGVPWTANGGLPELPDPLLTPSPVAQMVGNAFVGECLGAHGNPRKTSISSARLHVDLNSHYRTIISAAECVSVVTSLSGLTPFLEDRFGISVRSTWTIPGQASNLGTTPSDSHWPDRYRELVADMPNRVEPGELVLVAGGVLGKSYCAAVRAGGGVGVDIGSMAEAWLGIPVRGYHGPDFFATVNKWL